MKYTEIILEVKLAQNRISGIAQKHAEWLIKKGLSKQFLYCFN